jgi:hypothetical protein
MTTQMQIRQEIQRCPAVDLNQSRVQDLMMNQLFEGETYTKIIEGLYLGRAEDTVNGFSGGEDYFRAVICCTNERYLNDSLNESTRSNGTRVYPMKIVSGTDVGIDSFQDSQAIEYLLEKIDKTIISGRNVLVCCQQGKDRSALLVAMYLVNKFKVTAKQAVNFIKSKRPIVTVDEEKMPYWKFLSEYQRN